MILVDLRRYVRKIAQDHGATRRLAIAFGFTESEPPGNRAPGSRETVAGNVVVADLRCVSRRRVIDIKAGVARLADRDGVSLSVLSISAARVAWDAVEMSFSPATSTEDVFDQPIRAQFEVFLDEHRRDLSTCLDGLTEEQARRSLVPSMTTLLGLVKHATFVERVWSDVAVNQRSRTEIGIAATPEESFILSDDDTIATVQQAHREACESARQITAGLTLDDLVYGNRRGPLPLRWIYLHLLRELAQHCGHADILREQILNS
jgi:hypothetical protein